MNKSKNGSEMKKTEEQQRTRKEYARKGTRSQKMVSFRCDNDNVEWLESQSNKGRYINDLIADDRKKN